MRALGLLPLQRLPHWHRHHALVAPLRRVQGLPLPPVQGGPVVPLGPPALPHPPLATSLHLHQPPTLPRAQVRSLRQALPRGLPDRGPRDLVAPLEPRAHLGLSGHPGLVTRPCLPLQAHPGRVVLLDLVPQDLVPLAQVALLLQRRPPSPIRVRSRPLRRLVPLPLQRL